MPSDKLVAVFCRRMMTNDELSVTLKTLAAAAAADLCIFMCDSLYLLRI